MNRTSNSDVAPSSLGRIVVMGAAHIDRTGWLDAPSALGCSNPGRFEERPGGTALNIARVLSALRTKVQLISCVGDDSAGDWLRQEMCCHGITAYLETAQKTGPATGTYTSIIEPDGSLLVALADMAIYDTFSAALVQDHVNSLTKDDWLCVDTNLPPEQVKRLLQMCPAKKVGVTVSKAKATRLLAYADQLDLIFTNRVEAGALCSPEPTENALLREFEAVVKANGVNAAVISNGARDVAIVGGERLEQIAVEAVNEVTDVTGAGDALVAASLFALTSGGSLSQAVRYGIQAARATIQTKGAIRQDLIEQIGTFQPQAD